MRHKNQLANFLEINQFQNYHVDEDTKNLVERINRNMNDNTEKQIRHMTVLEDDVNGNKGFVELVDYMGDDYRILESARVSTGSAPSKGEKKDRGLIRYLYKNRHMSPFEQVTLTFKIKAPLFVIQQFLRHRTASFNQFSGRYSEMPMEYYVPKTFRKQSTLNHQGSEGNVDEEISEMTRNEMIQVLNDEVFDMYHNALYRDVAREQARGVLPTAMYSVFYMTINLRNLFHFLELRMDSHAQKEIQEYARAMFIILSNIEGLKWSVEVFEEFLYLDRLYQQAINAAKRNTDELAEALEAFIESKKDT